MFTRLDTVHYGIVPIPASTAKVDMSRRASGCPDMLPMRFSKGGSGSTAMNFVPVLVSSVGTQGTLTNHELADVVPIPEKNEIGPKCQKIWAANQDAYPIVMYVWLMKPVQE